MAEGNGWTTAYIGLGSNVGDRLVYLRDAVHRLDSDACKVVRVSSVYEAEPVGDVDQGWFLNAVAQTTTRLSAHELHTHLKATEDAVGRRPSRRWGPREIDLDLLLFGNERIDTPDLVVPHALLHDRRFVLWPLAELAHAVVHPNFGCTIEALQRRTSDASSVRIAMPAPELWAPARASERT